MSPVSSAGPVFEIAWDGPGRLATMAHPPGGRHLPGAMAALAEAGAQVLVSALCDDELRMLDLTDQPDAATTAGLELVRYPIVDVTAPVPEEMPEVIRLADQLATRMRAGRFVVTHCRAGIGRSSMLAGATLVRHGVSPTRAWQLIRAARGFPVPDNQEQESWLHDFATAAAG